ncbi:hypothetical protein EBU94_01090 [bacterium]|nr:hypothetical protein [bacterium]
MQSYTRQIRNYIKKNFVNANHVQVRLVSNVDGYQYYYFTNLFFHTAADVASSATGLSFEYCSESVTRIKN